MEITKMTGIKQFGLEAINFFVNTIIMGIVMVFINLGLFEFIEPQIIMFNIVLGIFFFFCLIMQNVFLLSVVYAFTNYKLVCDGNGKVGIILHNLFFNLVMIGTIIVKIVEVPSVVQFIVIGLLLLELIPSFIPKFSKPFSFCIFKINTEKKEKRKLENDGILL